MPGFQINCSPSDHIQLWALAQSEGFGIWNGSYWRPVLAADKRPLIPTLVSSDNNTFSHEALGNFHCVFDRDCGHMFCTDKVHVELLSDYNL